MATLISDYRVNVVLAMIAQGADCAGEIIRRTGFTPSSVSAALEALRQRKDIERCGTRRGNGGGTTKLYQVTARANVRLTEAFAHKSRLNGHRHHANAGLADRIREVLLEGPKTAGEVAQELELPEKTVMATLQQLATITGGVVAEGPKEHKTYRLYERGDSGAVRFDPDRPFRYAQPIRHGRGAKWGAGLA